MDLRPLRASPAFRRFWIGSACQTLGGQVTAVAVLYQIWQMTADSFWVGFVGLLHALPMIALGLVGGALADRSDRRQIVLLTTGGALAASLALAGQALAESQSLPLLLGLLTLQTAFSALGGPSRRTITARLLPTDQQGAGLALSQGAFQISLLAGPALAGLILARWGLKACYLLEALAFCLSLYGLARLPALPPQGVAAAERGRPAAIRDGLRFIRQRPLLSGSFLSDLAATFLAMPMALFPALNQMQFGGRPETLGLLFSAVAVGGVGATLLSRLHTRLNRPGQVQLLAAGLWGARHWRLWRRVPACP